MPNYIVSRPLKAIPFSQPVPVIGQMPNVRHALRAAPAGTSTHQRMHAAAHAFASPNIPPLRAAQTCAPLTLLCLRRRHLLHC